MSITIISTHISCIINTHFLDNPGMLHVCSAWGALAASMAQYQANRPTAAGLFGKQALWHSADTVVMHGRIESAVGSITSWCCAHTSWTVNATHAALCCLLEEHYTGKPCITVTVSGHVGCTSMQGWWWTHTSLFAFNCTLVPLSTTCHALIRFADRDNSWTLTPFPGCNTMTHSSL